MLLKATTLSVASEYLCDDKEKRLQCEEASSLRGELQASDNVELERGPPRAGSLQ